MDQAVLFCGFCAHAKGSFRARKIKLHFAHAHAPNEQESGCYKKGGRFVGASTESTQTHD